MAFFLLGCDLVGVIAPLSLEGHMWIITTIDYLTNWVEVVPLVTATRISHEPNAKTLFDELPSTLSSPKPHIIMVIMIFSLNF